ncbi:MAG TPA: DUF4097 family beta strand repeat-containing protein [Gemmatimonadaceae bacterium]|nr:DUF4097 family beta strand repeat-containing protein [Gemmatimonadaceae bacterium]
MNRTVLLSALLVVAAMPAAAQDRDRNRDRDEDYESVVDTTFAFDKRGNVSLSVGSGEIIVRAWNRDQVQVRARSERSTIRMDASSMRLTLDLSRPRGGDTRFELMVPVGVRISARATNGDISITGTKGGVEARTQSGDLTVEDVADMIDLGSLSGDIQARGLVGNIDISAVSGDVTVHDAKGDVEATSVSGDIDLRSVVARYVRAKSTSGDVTYDGTIDSTGRYELGSHSGSVEITIPQGAGAQMSVSTYTGTIESDFPITLQPGDHGLGPSKRFTFQIGKGDARVTAESFSGDITIRSTGRRPDR